MLICGSIVFHDRPVNACTAFCAANKDQVLVGNNEDWSNPRTKIWFVPAEDGAFGRMYVGFDDLTPQGGMNERGLWFDGFATLPIKVQNSGRPRFDGNLADKAMAECATVEEVVRLFERYDRSFLSEAILMFADATGDAVSIEANAMVRKRGRHFVQTNFHQSSKAEGGGLARFRIATSMLDAAGDEPSIDLFKRILSATHQGGGSPTLYSNIYELRSRTLLLYHFHDFEHVLRFDLVEELKKGARVLDIPALFPRNADAEAFAARQDEARRKQAGSAVPAGVWLGAALALPLLLVGGALYGWVKGEREVRLALLAAAGAIVLAGVSAIATLQFHRRASSEWVEFSIGPSSGNSAWIGPTVVRADGLTLRQALATAYDVPSIRVIGPEWISQVRYSINASVGPEAADSFRSLLRQELEHRVGVKAHTTVRPFDVFVLSASAPRLERGIGDGVRVWIHEADVQMQDVSMKDLTSALQGILGKPVIDETGIEGSYNLDFTWTKDRVESVTATLDRRFGLRLSPAKRDLSALIVDDIRRDPSMLLLDHVGRLTARAPASFRRQVSRILTVH